LYMKTFSPH